jgi:glycosyltransferase involved in cell wall biosynthesis
VADGGDRPPAATPVLIVTTELPGRVGGAQVRNLGLVGCLHRLGHPVTVVSLSDGRRSPDDLVAAGARVVTVPLRAVSPVRAAATALARRVPPSFVPFRDPALHEAVLREVARAGGRVVVQLEQVQAYDAVQPLLDRLRAAGHVIVLDAHNVEAVTFVEGARHLGRAMRAAGWWIAGGLRRRERAAAADADLVLTCSSEDAAWFAGPAPRVAVVPNGVDCAYFAPDAPPASSPAPGVLFMGGAAYPPNEDALRFYLDDVHPRVAAAVPGATFTAIGSSPPRWLADRAAADPTIVLPGFVPDVRDHVRAAAVCACPIRAGSGTRLKVLEYLAAGKAVVSTTKGSEGLEYVAGRDLLIADDAPAFADAVIALLGDPRRRAELGEAGRRLVATTYDWTVVAQRLADAYRPLAAMA